MAMAFHGCEKSSCSSYRLILKQRKKYIQFSIGMYVCSIFFFIYVNDKLAERDSIITVRYEDLSKGERILMYVVVGYMRKWNAKERIGEINNTKSIVRIMKYEKFKIWHEIYHKFGYKNQRLLIQNLWLGGLLIWISFVLCFTCYIFKRTTVVREMRLSNFVFHRRLC